MTIPFRNPGPSFAGGGGGWGIIPTPGSGVVGNHWTETIPDVIEPIRAARSWRPACGRLFSVARPVRWPKEGIMARCLRGVQINFERPEIGLAVEAAAYEMASVVEGPGSYVPWASVPEAMRSLCAELGLPQETIKVTMPHDPPVHLDCMCGIWGMCHPRALRPARSLPTEISGVIEMEGRTVRGTLGWRSERARVVALMEGSGVKEVADYYGVPVISEWPELTNPLKPGEILFVDGPVSGMVAKQQEALAIHGEAAVLDPNGRYEQVSEWRYEWKGMPWTSEQSARSSPLNPSAAAGPAISLQQLRSAIPHLFGTLPPFSQSERKSRRGRSRWSLLGLAGLPLAVSAALASAPLFLYTDWRLRVMWAGFALVWAALAGNGFRLWRKYRRDPDVS